MRSGCWLSVLERTVVFNCTSAPWSDHGFFGQIKEASQEYFRVRDWTCPLYALLYEAHPPQQIGEHIYARYMWKL